MSIRIDELAEAVASDTKVFSQYLIANNLAPPSFDENAPADYPSASFEVQQARRGAINACHELLDLLQGPQAVIRPAFNVTSLQAIHHFGILAEVPLNGEISFKDLATECQLYEPDIRRIIRFAITCHRLFREQRPGFVSHSVASRFLVDNSDARDALGFACEVTYGSFARTMDAMQKHRSQEPNKTGFNLALNTDRTFFSYLSSHADKYKMYSGAMKALTANLPGHSLSLLIDGYPWQSLGKATIVDVGGSNGQIACALAQAFPHLQFVVQDVPDVVEHARAPLDLASRAKFDSHNFFEPQTMDGDVYFFRRIFHDWPDSSVEKNLRQLIPALKPGARVIINDSVCPGPNTVPYDIERAIRALDMVMLTCHNSREREQHEWEPLFKRVDARFGPLKFYITPGAALQIIESVWQG